MSPQPVFFSRGLVGGGGPALDRLVKGLSLSIARRLTCTEPEGSVYDTADELSAKMLQARASMEVQRSAMKAERRAREDLSALRTLLVLCKPGQTPNVICSLLSTRLNEIHHITHVPPVELGLTGKNADRMNLTFLPRLRTQPLTFSSLLWTAGPSATAASQTPSPGPSPNSRLEDADVGFRASSSTRLTMTIPTAHPAARDALCAWGRSFTFLPPLNEEASFKRSRPTSCRDAWCA